MNKKTVVIGASPKADRYSHQAVRKLRRYGHDVVALGFEDDMIDDIPIETAWPAISQVDTVTLYLNPQRQQSYYDYILGLHPKRIIFNPGTENKDLLQRAQAQGIQTVEACTLVMLSTGQY